MLVTLSDSNWRLFSSSIVDESMLALPSLSKAWLSVVLFMCTLEDLLLRRSPYPAMMPNKSGLVAT